jgi:hypothetical protein
MTRTFLVWNFLSVFTLLMLLTPTLHAQEPNQFSPQNLTCSPAPCVFPNVMVSQGGHPILSNVMAVNPTNPSQMLVAADDTNCNVSFLGIFATQDAGTTWTHTCLPVTPKNTAGGDPTIAYDLNNVAYAVDGESPPNHPYSGQLVMRSSTDNGVTWETPAIVHRPGGYSARLAIDTNPTSPHKNSIYVSTTLGDFAGTKIAVLNSGDGGKTWNSTILDQTPPQVLDDFSNLAIAGDGTVYATWIRCKDRGVDPTCGNTMAPVFLAESSDGGNTWSAPAEVVQTMLSPDPGREVFWGTLPLNWQEPVFDKPAIAVDTSSQPTAGNVYLAYYNYNGNQLQVGVITSNDGGQTWSQPVRVSHSDIGDEFSPWLSVSSSGTLSVTWLDTRKAGRIQYQPFFAVSTDGGASFTGDRALSPVQSDIGNDGFGGYYTSYLQTHVWVGNAICATWMDTSTGSGQIELGGVQF